MAKSRNLPGGLQNSGTQAAVSTASRDEPGGQRHPAKRGVCSNSRLAGDLTQVAGSRRAAAVCSSQNRMPISWYIVVAIARWSSAS